jgi:predicted O-methyltransferase YrrM
MTGVDIARARAIKGWMSQRELRWLAEHAQEAHVIIEIGCSRGRSTRALGDHTLGTVYTVDPWHDVPEYRVGYGEWAYAEAQRNLGDLIAAGRVMLIRGESASMAPTLMQTLGGRVDLVFIDGDHSYDGCRRDIEAYRPMLRPGGILSGHDYNRVPRHAGVRQSVDECVPGVQVAGSIWWAHV